MEVIIFKFHVTLLLTQSFPSRVGRGYLLLENPEARKYPHVAGVKNEKNVTPFLFPLHILFIMCMRAKSIAASAHSRKEMVKDTWNNDYSDGGENGSIKEGNLKVSAR